MQITVGARVKARWFNASYSPLHNGTTSVQGQFMEVQGTARAIFRNTSDGKWCVEVDAEGTTHQVDLVHVIAVLMPVATVPLALNPKAIEAARLAWTSMEWDEHATPDKDMIQHRDYVRAGAALQAAVEAHCCETFEQAWARMEAKGYQYGEDALEQVRFGWELARGEE